MNRLRALVLAIAVTLGLVSAPTLAQATPAHTVAAATPSTARANLAYWINRVDPKRTIRWNIRDTRIPGNYSGLAYPRENRIELSSVGMANNSWAKYLVMHEWAHILQYRAYGGSWSLAIINASLLQPGVPQDTALEREADCVYYAMGGTKVANRSMYGCPNNAPLRGAARRIAAKNDLTKLEGKISAAIVQGRTLIVRGWVGDPTRVSAQTRYKIRIDNRDIAVGATNLMRSDVNNYYGYVGKHGFDRRVQLAKGVHRVCVVSTAWTLGGENVVSCTTVRVR